MIFWTPSTNEKQAYLPSDQNRELYERYHNMDIVKFIKFGRLHWGRPCGEDRARYA